MQSNIRNGERHSTASAYLRPILDRPNLHISLNSFATKVNEWTVSQFVVSRSLVFPNRI